MKTQATTQGIGTVGKARSAVLLSLAVGTALAGMVALAGTAQQAEAALTEKIVFSSNRTTGTGVDNPTGDNEIFKMNPDGTGLKQLTFNTAYEYYPVLSPDGRKIAYMSWDVQPSNPEGDEEVYVMNALDGLGKKNLSNSGVDVDDSSPVFSPDGKKIAYESEGVQPSNPEGDPEIYRVNVLDGLGKRNLSNNGTGVSDWVPDFSPNGKKIAYQSQGVQPSNPEGEHEIYRMNSLDGLGKRNLSNNGVDIEDRSPDFSPDGTKIVYGSRGIQSSNPEGENEVYVMNSLDGLGKRNLSNNGTGVFDYNPVISPDGTKIAYQSYGVQDSNPEGETEVYVMNSLDGLGKKNLSNNGTGVFDELPSFSPDGTKIAYESHGVQPSNPEGDDEIYRVNVLDGLGTKNLTDNGQYVYDDNPGWGRESM